MIRALVILVALSGCSTDFGSVFDYSVTAPKAPEQEKDE